jgi:hypothetical protein
MVTPKAVLSVLPTGTSVSNKVAFPVTVFLTVPEPVVNEVIVPVSAAPPVVTVVVGS